MHIHNTSSIKTVYLSVDGVNEEIAPDETKLLSPQHGTANLHIGTRKGSVEWSGVVPTDPKKTVTIGCNPEPFVMYADELMPNCLQTASRMWIWIILALILIGIVFMLLRKEN